MSDKSNLNFRSAYSKFDIFPSEPGSLTRPEYRDKVLENGAVSVEQIGEFDLDALIQSSKDECLIYNILQRSVSDPSVLSKTLGVFSDVRDMQVPYTQNLQRVLDAERAFYNLPVELRKEFDNNISVFLEKAQTEEGLAILRKYESRKPSINTESEVVSDESVSA